MELCRLPSMWLRQLLDRLGKRQQGDFAVRRFRSKQRYEAVCKACTSPQDEDLLLTAEAIQKLSQPHGRESTKLHTSFSMSVVNSTMKRILK